MTTKRYTIDCESIFHEFNYTKPILSEPGISLIGMDLQSIRECYGKNVAQEVFSMACHGLDLTKPKIKSDIKTSIHFDIEIMEYQTDHNTCFTEIWLVPSEYNAATVPKLIYNIETDIRCYDDKSVNRSMIARALGRVIR